MTKNSSFSIALIACVALAGCDLFDPNFEDDNSGPPAPPAPPSQPADVPIPGEGDDDVDPIDEAEVEIPAACERGDTMCTSGIELLLCGAGDWDQAVTCEYVCRGGACTGDCTPGADRCSGDMPEICNNRGEWVVGSPCEFVCANGACVGSCSPGSGQCNLGVPETCSSDGSWQAGEECQFACVEGECTGVCVPGERDCSGGQTRVCSSVGQWVIETACPFVCVEGECTGECVPGNTKCLDDSVRTCDSDGMWSMRGISLCVYACSEAGGEAHCLECDPGSKACDGSDLLTCDSDGIYGAAESCSYGCASDIGGAFCYEAPTLRVVNDLPGGTDSAGNDWGKLNTVIDFRVAPSGAAITGVGGIAYEQLTPYDAVTSIIHAEQILPGESMVVDVASLAPNYSLYFGFGYWDYTCWGAYCSWEKHHSAVMCCDNANLCNKLGAFSYIDHLGGEAVVSLSSLFPSYSWPGHPSCQ